MTTEFTEKQIAEVAAEYAEYKDASLGEYRAARLILQARAERDALLKRVARLEQEAGGMRAYLMHVCAHDYVHDDEGDLTWCQRCGNILLPRRTP